MCFFILFCFVFALIFVSGMAGSLEVVGFMTESYKLFEVPVKIVGLSKTITNLPTYIVINVRLPAGNWQRNMNTRSEE